MGPPCNTSFNVHRQQLISRENEEKDDESKRKLPTRGGETKGRAMKNTRDDIPRKIDEGKTGGKKGAGIRVASYCRASTDLWNRYQFFSPRRS